MKKNESVETFCVGRHSIDLPTGFRLAMPLSASLRPERFNNAASSIEVGVIADGMTSLSFVAAVSKRQGEILALSDDTTDILKEVIDKGENATLLRILKIEQSYADELHFLKSNLYFILEAKSYDGRFLEAEANLLKMADYIFVTQSSDGEVQNGFCLGPVVARGEFQEESATFEFRNDKQPDVVVKIEIDSFGRDETRTLLQRVDGPDSILVKFDARNTVLRKGKVIVAGQPAEEWLSSVKLGANRDWKQFGFALETTRRKPGSGAARIHIDLDTGQYDQHGVKRPNSMSDEQAIALWDLLVSSMRLREQ